MSMCPLNGRSLQTNPVCLAHCTLEAVIGHGPYQSNLRACPHQQALLSSPAVDNSHCLPPALKPLHHHGSRPGKGVENKYWERRGISPTSRMSVSCTPLSNKASANWVSASEMDASSTPRNRNVAHTLRIVSWSADWWPQVWLPCDCPHVRFILQTRHLHC